MRVIARRRLREFWEADGPSARMMLEAWERVVKQADWRTWPELKETFGTAERVGTCTVFDLGSRRIRLVGRVSFDKGRVFVLRVMNQKEFHRTDWAEPCRCHGPELRS